MNKSLSFNRSEAAQLRRIRREDGAQRFEKREAARNAVDGANHTLDGLWGFAAAIIFATLIIIALLR